MHQTLEMKTRGLRLRPILLLLLLFQLPSLSPGFIMSINCVGDSITAGVGVANPTLSSYPAKLHFLLGTNYLVGNYGVSGTTLLEQGDMPYWNTTLYITSHGKPNPPNVVIIMLGSNDSKPQNWIYGTNFVSDYTNLVATYTTLSTNPRVLICTPPPVFGNNGPNITPGIVATNISPLIRSIGTNLNLQVIDFQVLLAGHSEWFPDNVHPNELGTSVMAAIVYTALFGDAMNGSAPVLNFASRPSNNAAILTWPGPAAGWALESIPALGGTNTWTICGATAFFNGTSLLLTNPVATPKAFFRLWNPSFTTN
jgi:lysophospholipase L1-like esterase